MVEKRAFHFSLLDYSKENQATFRRGSQHGRPMDNELIAQKFRQAELAITQARIISLGLQSENVFLPDQIPDIDTIINPWPLEQLISQTIEIDGLIGAGKNSLFDLLAVIDLPVTLIPEGAGYLFTELYSAVHGSHFGPKFFAAQKERDGHLSLSVFFAPDTENKSRVYNRGPIDDITLGRALFLSGIIDYKSFADFYFNLDLHLPQAIAIAMVNPQEGLERKLLQLGRKPTEYSALLNPQFMQTLYQQYLRLISELRDMEQPNLVVINTSGGFKPVIDKSKAIFNQLFNRPT